MIASVRGKGRRVMAEYDTTVSGFSSRSGADVLLNWLEATPEPKESKAKILVSRNVKESDRRYPKSHED